VSGVPLVLGSAAALCALAAVRRGSRSQQQRTLYRGPKPQGTVASWQENRWKLGAEKIGVVDSIPLERLPAGSTLYHGTCDSTEFQAAWPSDSVRATWVSNDPYVAEYVALGLYDDEQGRVIVFTTTRDLTLARLTFDLARLTRGQLVEPRQARGRFDLVCDRLAEIGADGWRLPRYYGALSDYNMGDNGDDILICAKDALKVQRVRAVPKPWYRRPW